MTTSKNTGKDKFEEFLFHLRRMPDKTTAASKAGIDIEELVHKIQVDAKFEKAVEDATETGIDAMEDEVVRRAFLGVEEPIFQGGFQVGTKVKYSDDLLKFYLAANRAKYRGDIERDGRGLSQEARETIASVFGEAAAAHAAGKLPNGATLQQKPEVATSAKSAKPTGGKTPYRRKGA